MKLLEIAPVILMYFTYAVIILNLYGLYVVFVTQTKIGQRFERWLFKKLGIDPDIK